MGGIPEILWKAGFICKPGNNNGEYKYGCSVGTMKVWISQNGWAPDCQVGGLATLAGESKPLFTDTDGGGFSDIWDLDNDNDGIPDSSDDSVDDADTVGSTGHGKPDWWEKKNPGK